MVFNYKIKRKFYPLLFDIDFTIGIFIERIFFIEHYKIKAVLNENM